MKMLSLAVIVCALTYMVATARGDPPNTDNSLVNAIIQVESNGDDKAVGDNGKALGCLQIHKAMVDDVNRILGRQAYTYNDRLNRGKSIEMFNIYTSHYSPGATDEVVTRRWNGGPKGDRKTATVAYWYKVRRHLMAV